jgi:hypothetical protein
MTATLDISLTPDVLADKPCECERDHHPNHNPHCDQSPRYAVRIRHVGSCGEVTVYLLCQDCLDEAVAWADALVGCYCNQCMTRVLQVSDLVGPVVEL